MMRVLYKNQRTYHYALPIAVEPILDEYGNDTLEVETIYCEPIEAKANYSAAVGQEAVAVFGTTTDYSRVFAFAGDCPLKEGAILWIGKDTAEAANYRVVRVADSLNGTLVAVGEIA